MIAFVISLLSFGAWIYLAGFRGKFWRSGPVLESQAPTGRSSVVVLVPARNEAENIPRIMGALLAQDYPGAFSVILVDDNSTDGTAAIAASFAHRKALTILPGDPLPPGWTGKLWAVHQGLIQPEASAAGFVLLTDADIVHAPGHVSALVAKAEAEGLDLVSEMVRLHCHTAAERALIPAFIFFFQMLYPFAWTADPGKRVAGAAGGTMLMSRAAIERVQGVSRIRHHLIDDCALAKEIKSSGGKIWLGHSEQAESVRVYTNWREIWDMIARTAYVQLGYSPLMLLGCVAGMSILYEAPPLLGLFAPGLPRWLGMLSWLVMALVFQPTLRRYGRSPIWGFALPVISLFYLGATVASALRHYTRSGGRWKGRVYQKKRVT